MTHVFNAIIGKTIEKIHGLQEGSDSVDFQFTDGNSFQMYHSQDCCESVSIESIAGDVAWLIGKPLLMAEVVESDPTHEPPKPEYQPESETWTFVKFATNNGAVTVRWYGESNGYYGETPAFNVCGERAWW